MELSPQFRVAVLLLALCQSVLVRGQTDSATDEPTVTASFFGGGSVVPDKAFDEWFYSFQFVRPDVEIEYIYSTSDNGIQQLIDGEVDFAAISGPITEEQSQSTTPPNDLFQFPILLAPMVLVYNLPYGGIMDPTDQSADLKLILDRNVTAGIFSGRITHWRDPDLLAIQRPAVAALLPNATIQLVVRRDGSSDTQTFQEAVRSFNPEEWRWGNVSSEWPEEFLNMSHVSAEVEAWGVIAANVLVPNSLSYVPFEEIAAADQIKYASMPNKLGEVLDYPELGTLLDEIQFDPETYAPTGSFNDDDDSWPMTSLIYVVMRKANYKAATCSQRRDLLLFWRWAMTTHITVKHTQELGYDPLRRHDVEEIVDFWSRKVHCPDNGESLVEMLPIQQHEGAAFHAVLGVDVFALIATVVMVTVYLIRDWSSLSPSAGAYYVVLAVGSVLNYVAVILFWRVPSSDSICFGRQWLACIGFSMTLAAIFSRGFQVRAIQQLATSKSLSKKVHHSLIMGLGTSVIVGIQLVLLGVWTAVDPFSAIEYKINESNLTFQYICSSKHPLIWWGLEIAFAVSLLAFGLYVVYQTWDLKHMVRESKWISISIYNCVVVLVLVAVLLSIIEVNDDGVFWIAGTATLFLTFTTITSLVLPRALKLRSLANTGNASDDSSTNRSNSKVGGKESVASSPRGRKELSTTSGPASMIEPSRMASTLGPKGQPCSSMSTMSPSTTVKEANGRVELAEYSIRTSKFGSHVGDVDSPKSSPKNSPKITPRRMSLNPNFNLNFTGLAAAAAESVANTQSAKDSPRRRSLQTPLTYSSEAAHPTGALPDCPGGMGVTIDIITE